MKLIELTQTQKVENSVLKSTALMSRGIMQNTTVRGSAQASLLPRHPSPPPPPPPPPPPMIYNSNAVNIRTRIWGIVHSYLLLFRLFD
jgi:hypothetical protein